MFYAEPLLVRKGQFSHLWLAAHWEKKLTKAHVVETDVVATVKCLLDEPIKLALRTSGHLLLGIVRIFSRKLKYLLTDCNEVHVKIKVAFRPGVIDLPTDQGKDGQLLPDLFSEFDMAFTDVGRSDIDWQAQFAMNQARLKDITLPPSTIPQAVDMPMDEGDFGELNADSGKLLSDEFKISVDFDMGVDASTKDFLPGESDLGIGSKLQFEQADDLPAGVEFMEVDQPRPETPPPIVPEEEEPQVDTTIAPDYAGGDETTIVAHPAEGFVLPPLNDSQPSGFIKPLKRKRPLIVDDQLQLSNDQIRGHLRDTSDVVQPCQLAPRSKRAAIMAEHGTAEALFTTPASMLYNGSGCASAPPSKVMQFYKTNCRVGKPAVNASFNKSISGLDDASTEEFRPAADQTSDFRIGDDTTLNDLPPPELEKDEMAFDMLPPEQEEMPLEPEPVEEKDESVTSKRRRFASSTTGVYDVIREEAGKKGGVAFDRILTATNKKDRNVSVRKNAARVFQSMLLLVREGKVDLQQAKPFDTISARCQ